MNIYSKLINLAFFLQSFADLPSSQNIKAHNPQTLQKHTSSFFDFVLKPHHLHTATTTDEAEKVLSASFDYITEKNGIMLFRKPKRFKA
jgi:hypothetical protein